MKTQLLLLMLFSLSAHAGSFTGNGADRKGPGHGAAWFLGNRTIHWCTNNALVEPALKSAVGKWRSYLESKKITLAMRAPLPFSLEFEKLRNCDSADLQIEVSTDSEANVLSGSELLDQDLASGWGKGLIWVNTEVLKRPGALEAQLIHQVGHLLGNDHVGGTVMAESVANLAQELPTISAIDGSRELYLCRGCTSNWKDANGAAYSEANGSALVAGNKLAFTADLAIANHDDAKIFSVAVGTWASHLTSESLARLGVLQRNGQSEQVIVRRNFDKLLEIHLLNSGRPELYFEVRGQ